MEEDGTNQIRQIDGDLIVAPTIKKKRKETKDSIIVLGYLCFLRKLGNDDKKAKKKKKKRNELFFFHFQTKNEIAERHRKSVFPYRFFFFLFK